MGKMSHIPVRPITAACVRVFLSLSPPVYYKNVARHKPHCDASANRKIEGAGLCVCCRAEEELRKLREETNVDSLRQELDRERSKRLELEQKMNEAVRSR